MYLIKLTKVEVGGHPAICMERVAEVISTDLVIRPATSADKRDICYISLPGRDSKSEYRVHFTSEDYLARGYAPPSKDSILPHEII